MSCSTESYRVARYYGSSPGAEIEKTPEGQPYAIMGTIHDITDLKAYDAAVRASEEKYRLIAESTSDVIWVYNCKSEKFTYMSPSVEQLLGFSVEESMQMSIKDIMTHDMAEGDVFHISEAVTDFLNNPEKQKNNVQEAFLRHKNGGFVCVEVTGRLRFNDQGEVELVGSSRDISERKTAEREISDRENALHRNEFFLKQAQAVSKTGHWYKDHMTGSVEWSDEMYRIFGFELGSNITFERVLDSVHPDDRERVNALEAQADFELRSYEVVHRVIVDGEIKWVESRSEFQTDHEGHLISNYWNRTRRHRKNRLFDRAGGISAPSGIHGDPAYVGTGNGKIICRGCK